MEFLLFNSSTGIVQFIVIIVIHTMLVSVTISGMGYNILPENLVGN